MADPIPQQERQQGMSSEAPLKPWEKLGFEKIAATDAEGGTGTSGVDAAIYS